MRATHGRTSECGDSLDSHRTSPLPSRFRDAELRSSGMTTPVNDKAHEAAAIRDALDTGEIRDVLAIRASRLGDLLMTTPTLEAFRQRFDKSRITLLTNPYSAGIVQGSSSVDATIVFEGRERDLVGHRGRKLAAGLRGKYQLLLALRPRRELESFARRADIGHVFPGGAQSERRDRHVVTQCYERIAPLGLPASGPGPLRVTMSTRELDDVRSELGLWRPFVQIHPGCDETMRIWLRRGVRRRVWPAERWIELIDTIHTRSTLEVVLTSGSAVEHRINQHIAGRTLRRPKLAHRLPLRKLMSLSSLARACITIDTGPMHLATAVGTQLVGLYGPSPVEYTGPWAPNGQAEVLRADLPCMPCQGKNVHCPRNVCMEEIRVHDVVACLERCAIVS
ncbi:MAG: glycosyltransferase family 9 protein [Planctomycetes bacterium]|nr:glycosyltransferase family 9 protein [Planctomycetota bacterium]